MHVWFNTKNHVTGSKVCIKFLGFSTTPGHLFCFCLLSYNTTPSLKQALEHSFHTTLKHELAS